MPIITKIEKQKKEGRYNIFLDNVFAFGLYKESIYHYQLRVGDDIEYKKSEEIKNYDEFIFGKNIGYRYLSYKPRSEKELIKKLKEKKISDENISKLINYFKELKFINDLEYSKIYIDEILRLRPEGKRKLILRLKEKGINKNLIDEVVNEMYDEDNEFEKAMGITQKYIRKSKFNSSHDKKNKCYRYLVSKGFDYETINRVITQFNFG